MRRGGLVFALAAGLLLLFAPIAPATEGDAPALVLPDLSGRWAMVEVMPAIASLPFVGDVELTTIVTALVDIEQDGTSLVLRDVYCFVDVQMNPPVVESRVPERFMQALRPAPRTAELRMSGAGWRFVQPPVVEVRGASLVDPERDPLPLDAFDSRVFDQDGDGHPGLTIPVTVAGLVVGDTYVVQRLRTALSGWVIDSNTIVGSIDWSSEQSVLAASDALLTLSYSYRLHPDAARHAFVMRRVDLEWTCDTTRERLPSLLGPTGL
jgi:hypothetical protein